MIIPPLHPLAGATKFGVIELGHAAVTANHRLEHAHHGVSAEPMSLGYLFDQLLAGGAEYSHGDPLMFLPTPGSTSRSAICSVPEGAIQRESRKLGNVAG
nr:hypothetical protein [Paraburkholderia youngii]